MSTQILYKTIRRFKRGKYAQITGAHAFAGRKTRIFVRINQTTEFNNKIHTSRLHTLLLRPILRIYMPSEGAFAICFVHQSKVRLMALRNNSLKKTHTIQYIFRTTHKRIEYILYGCECDMWFRVFSTRD